MQKTHLILLSLWTLLNCLPCRADSIAVLLALESDLKTLSQEAQRLGEPVSRGKRKMHRLQIGPHRVYAALMGSGCVETAVTTQCLLSQFHCDTVFSIGPAGSLTNEMTIGQWLQIKGCLVAGKHTGPGSRGNALVFQTVPETWTLPEALQQAPQASLVAGEVFIGQQTQRDSLATQSGADLVDMNTHGLWSACDNLRVPMYAWRIVSDHANESASQDFRAFVSNYDGQGGKMLAELIRTLPANPKAASSYTGIQKLIEATAVKKEQEATPAEEK